jgi:hypothetical protein
MICGRNGLGNGQHAPPADAPLSQKETSNITARDLAPVDKEDAPF